MANCLYPPYFQRKAEAEDLDRYQTVYSKAKGAIAAPTAGLHFTDQILTDLKDKGVQLDYLTLHVSAGTFQPVKHEIVTDHPMHSEQMVVTKENIAHLSQTQNAIIAVGTTSMRTLESLYWYGTHILLRKDTRFAVKKLAPYENYEAPLPSRQEAMGAILETMEASGVDTLTGETEIFIFPGYQFQVCNGLITNFHMPGSTLIMLIAAFIGEDWRHVYEEALNNDYRFLSYGDSSILLP